MTQSHSPSELPPPQPHSAAPPQAAEVLRCETTADFLAALPRLAGFTAPNSLFIVLFAGSRATATLRVDLPSGQDIPHYLDALTTDLRSFGVLPGHSAPAIVISSEQTFAEAAGVPWLQFARSLERRLLRAGIGLRELCCLAPDGWASYFDARPPRGGHPLEAIRESRVAPVSAPPLLHELGNFETPSSAERAAVAEAMLRTSPATNTQESRARLDLLFSADPFDVATIATLLQALETDTGWVRACDELSRYASSSFRLGPLGAAAPGCASSGRVLAVPSREASSAQAQLRAAAERLVAITPFCPRTHRPRLIILTALAWWMLGLPSVAQRQLDEASRLQPHYRAVAFAREVIASGGFPRTNG